ncbi:MlaD family protein [Mycolicibacterium nivoides]|uniref:MlaD family protein n=1 Tax=Mycolicibacterium nivoides TaxID=2487344 RepID=UPI001F14F05B|nr:MCE family protein [Mycolicibacterium nivoides]
MGNSLEMDGRGPTDRQLLACGAAVLVVAALVSTFLLVKATGRLDARVPVVAALVNVGDGLPQRSDVKYHGVLVGMVDDVVPAANGDPNFVHIDLKPEYAGSIPNTVTARVVPSNVFAVSSVQLVDRGPGAPISAGAQIPEDTELPTVLFQTTISKLRDVLAATGRGREDKTVGILAAVNAATENRRTELLTSGAQLNRLIDQLDSVVATEPGETTVSALIDATHGLQQTAPDLLDALHKAVQPMQTLVQQRSQLNTMINGGINTVGTTHTALDNHTDQLVKTTSNLTPVLGVLADTSNNWVPAFVKLNQLSGKFFDHVWIPEHDFGNMRVNLSLTPSYAYTRAPGQGPGQAPGQQQVPGQGQGPPPPPQGPGQAPALPPLGQGGAPELPPLAPGGGQSSTETPPLPSLPGENLPAAPPPPPGQQPAPGGPGDGPLQMADPGAPNPAQILGPVGPDGLPLGDKNTSAPDLHLSEREGVGSGPESKLQAILEDSSAYGGERE